MIKNYMLMLLRQVGRNRFNYTINILGLSFGLACCIIAYLHISYQYSYDTFHEKPENIYRLVAGDPNSTDYWAKVSAPMPAYMEERIPSIESFIHFNKASWNEKVLIESGGAYFLEPHFMMASSNFFQFFNFPLLQGNPETVLENTNSIVITESIALKLFGEEDPIGEIIRLSDNELDFIVTGIMHDLPENTHLQCDYLISFENLEKIFGTGRWDAWGEFNYFSYLRLTDGSSQQEVQSDIQSIVVDLPGQEQRSFQEIHIQPVKDIHFNENRGNLRPAYDLRYIYIFASLAICLLVISTMNFFNLTAMQSIGRVREVGVRKALGAVSRQVSFQFILENLLIVIICLILSVIWVSLLSQSAASMLGSPVTLELTDPGFLLFFIGIALFLGLISGIYLTVYVNRLLPGWILKGNLGSGRSNTYQKSLLFIQLSISLALILTSVIMVRQMWYLEDKDLGYDKESVISIPLSKDLPENKLEVLRKEITALSSVKEAAFSDFIPGSANWNQTTWWEGQTVEQSMFVMSVGQGFIEVMGMKLLEGSLEEIASSRETQFLINESARKHIGWESALGRSFSPFGGRNPRPVSGVIEDFNFRSLHHGVAPLVIVVFPERNFSQLMVKLQGERTEEEINEVKNAFNNVIGPQPFEYSFLDERLEQLYTEEYRMQSTMVILAIIAVFFALMGIYSLVSLAIESRSREIAVRKVLGISTTQLYFLFTATYMKIAIAGSVIVFPVCWKLLSSWLQKFTYHINMGVFNFIMAIGLLVLLIGMIGMVKYLNLSRFNLANSLRSD